MTTESWLLYVGTVLIFMSTPGPSHLLILSVSLSNGFRRSLATAAGDLTANSIQILLAGLGLAAVITASRFGFAMVKWIGVLYLVWMGIRQFLASFRRPNESTGAPTRSLRHLWLQGFVTSAANPKAVVFFAALFPQFLNPQHSLIPQIAILGATYIVIDGCFLCAYGSGASWLSKKVRGKHKAWVERAAGGGFIVAAVLLGLRTNEQS